MKNKTLDLRYNELWTDADDVYEHQEKTDHVHGRLSLSWKNLSVSVKQKNRKFFKRSEIRYKKILDNVNGNVHCGTLLGIMGPSGSGKTTLVATISHRIKGNFDGELLFNGRPISEEVMIKISGFVPQHDIGFDQLSVREHLTLMAILKMDRQTTQAGVRQRIDYTIVKLGMSQFLNTRISFLSGGERKKVALAVQLLSDPPILFCDEITTGLDSYSALNIVNTLKRVARTGKIVVCTIHQPASGVYGKFDEVLLLSNGQLVYQGPIPMVRQLFEKFNYECPRMFNEADYVISILSSDSEKVKRDMDEICKLSLRNLQTDINFVSLKNQKRLGNMKNLQTKKPPWTTQFGLIFIRSSKCFSRSYKTKLLEIGILLFLGIIIASPFSNTKFDSKAVQNWEGFWLILVNQCLIHYIYDAIPGGIHTFSIVHREVHNKVYPLSTYYVSELIIMLVWILIKISIYCAIVFNVVGIAWGGKELCLIYLVALSGFSFGSLVSSSFNNIENALILIMIYEYLALPLSGMYLSIKSLSKLLYYARYFSLYFLACESIFISFWEKIHYLPCNDVENCLNSGQAVLNKYGYIRGEFYSDLTILISFCILANVLGYFGILKKMKKQPAY